MRAARFKPDAQVPQPANVGPRLVPPRETVPSQAPAEAIEARDPSPMVMMLIAVLIAFTGALTFAGSVLAWLVLRNTGVNWMFQR